MNEVILRAILFALSVAAGFGVMWIFTDAETVEWLNIAAVLVVVLLVLVPLLYLIASERIAILVGVGSTVGMLFRIAWYFT